MNLAHACLEKNARRIPHRPAVIDGVSGHIRSYAELNAQASAAANALKSLGVGKGDRVALYLPNIPEFIVAFFAIAKIGAIAVHLNKMLKKMEINFILEHSGAKILIGMGEQTNENVLPIWDSIPSLEKIIFVRGSAGEGSNANILAFDTLLLRHQPEFTALDVDDDDGLALLYTSGTTGKPKGALSTHANWLSQSVINSCHVLPMSEENLVLTGTPFFHVYVVTTVLASLYAGAAVVSLPRFFAKAALELVTQYKITHFLGTPTMWSYLIEEYLKNKGKYDVSSLWCGQCAGSSLAAELGKKIETVFDLGLVECYGSTETSSTVTHTRFKHFRPGSAGWPAPGWAIKIVNTDGEELPNGEIGELCCKGPGVIKEYWNEPRVTAMNIRDGWWKSGDLAYVRGEGHSDCVLYLVDRKDDMLVCGGYNIYPSEVEGYLLKNPKILQAVVVGIPDEVKGEIPKAFVVLAPGETLTEDEIIRWAKENMAAYKAPRRVDITSIDELPKTVTGKILKRELRCMERVKKGVTISSG
ncbi:MAG TPA: AMP-dependent synthetase [Desulfobulbaceae bacterium]|nr:AMP-dependent synthetase [Desulfobulbaceae bacterium]